MASCKKIWWRPDIPEKDGKQFANIHLLVGYNQGTLDDYADMLKEMQKDFPDATPDVVECSRVVKSDSMYHFSIIIFNAHVPRGDYKGWQQHNGDTLVRQQSQETPDYWWA
jgi:hypothetical protein